MYNVRHFFDLIRPLLDMNASYKTLSKTLISTLSLLAVSALPVTVMADSADDIQQRIKKVGKLNIGDAPAPAAASAPAAAQNSESAAPAQVNGADLYQANCFACHGTGAAGAPILGQADAWAPRIAKGEATLIESAINGFNAMPPRGGTTLDDDGIKATVAYMIESSQ